jgi:hypothetical protein
MIEFLLSWLICVRVFPMASRHGFFFRRRIVFICHGVPCANRFSIFREGVILLLFREVASEVSYGIPTLNESFFSGFIVKLRCLCALACRAALKRNFATVVHAALFAALYVL